MSSRQQQPPKANLCRLLKLEQGCTHRDIKMAYKKMALLYHPDKTKGDPQKTQQFKEITEAYSLYMRNASYYETNLNESTKKKSNDNGVRIPRYNSNKNVHETKNHKVNVPQYKAPSNKNEAGKTTPRTSKDPTSNDQRRIVPRAKDSMIEHSETDFSAADIINDLVVRESDKEVPMMLPKKDYTKIIMLVIGLLILLAIVLCLVFLLPRKGPMVVNAFKTSYYLNTTSIIETQQELWGEIIPSELGLLTRLTILRLFSNDLTGTFPTELGELTALTSLWVYNNELSGQIPSELGLLTQLTELSLPFNQFSGPVPSQLGLLTQLSYLSFRENDLTGTIPWQLGELTALTTLKFSKNFMTGQVPSNLCELSKLTYIELDCYMNCTCYRCSSCT